jgi:hypothetical protein
MVEHDTAGALSFRLYRPEASSVELAGCFTGWLDRPIRMSAEGDGWWSARVELAPGDYEFRYLVDRRDWQTDYAASGVRRDDLAGWMSLLHVPAHAPLPASIPVPVPERETAEVSVRTLRPVRAA